MPKKSRTFQVRIQRGAVDDLDRIYSYIREDSPNRARRFLATLKSKITGLRRFPHRGSRARILDLRGTEIRFLEHRKYLIFYVVEGSDVIVLHVAHPGQDWIKFFL